MRIYVPSADIAQRTAVRLSDEKAHHVLTVTRAAAGTKLVVFDGEGRQYQATVPVSGKRRFSLISSTNFPMPPNLITTMSSLQRS